MEILIILLAMFGLTFALKEIDGPFDLIVKFRSKLIQNQYVGVFFYKLFSCYFCTGFHGGWIIYLLHEKVWHWNLLIIWGLAGGSISLIIDGLLTKLHSDNVDN